MKKIFLIVLLIFATTGFIASSFAENVIIQANKQSYDAKNNIALFEGNVKVNANDITVKSPKAFLKTDSEGKPKTATFLNGAYAVKENGIIKNEVKSQIMKLSLLDNLMVAEGNVKSIVSENKKPIAVINSNIQEYNLVNKTITAKGKVIIQYNDIKTDSANAQIDIDASGKPSKVDLTGSVKLFKDKSEISAENLVFNPNTKELTAQGNSYSESLLEDNTKVQIWSDYQQFVSGANTINTSGKVKIIYKDYVATGPKAVFVGEKGSTRPNKIIFIGRAKITELARTVEADKIEITANPKNFTAEGNVKTQFVQVRENKNTQNKTKKKKTKTQQTKSISQQETSLNNEIKVNESKIFENTQTDEINE